MQYISMAWIYKMLFILTCKITFYNVQQFQMKDRCVIQEIYKQISFLFQKIRDLVEK